MAGHAVIAGAGIAGPALAHQLNARGWQTTVIERYPHARGEGQNVDIRGAAREVARRMGIEEDIRAANTGEVGMRLAREDGSTAAAFPKRDTNEIDGPTAELEILRGELARILVDRTKARTDYRFGVQISDLTDHGDHVTAVLTDGTTIDSDVVVVAEGLRSRSRRFVTTADVDDLGMYFAYLTIKRVDTDDRWWTWQHATGSRAVHLRPDNVGTTRAILTFMADVRGVEDLDRADQIHLLRRTFADIGGPAWRILAELDDAPMYFDAVGQLTPTRWSRGRVALIGDAAFCNATFGGAGTSLALIGAYVLAGELSRGDDHPAALTRYGSAMGPFTKAAPRVSPAILRRANPRTPNGIRALHTGARLVASAAGRAITDLAGARLVTGAHGANTLPDY